MPKTISLADSFIKDKRYHVLIGALENQPFILCNSDDDSVQELAIEEYPFMRIPGATVEVSLSADHRFFVFTFFYNTPADLRAQAGRMECGHLDTGKHTCGLKI